MKQLNFDFNYGTPGTSLRIASNHRYDPELEVAKLFNEIWSDYQQLLKGNYDSIAEDYQNLLYKVGEESKFMSDQEIFKGILVEVDKEGAAIIEVDGKQKRCIHPQTRMIVK